jgi:predicted phage terminase large subunit-like protein
MQAVAKDLGILKKTVMTPYPVVTFITQDKGVAEAMFCSADQPDSLRGSNNDSCWLDEATYMDKQAFEIGISRLRGVGGRMGQCRLTMTPRGRAHWTFRVFYEDAPWQPENDEEGRHHGWHKIGPLWYKPKDNTELIQAATWENPFISEEYYAQLKSLYSSSFAQQELEGQFVDVLGLLFKREWFAGKTRDTVPRRARRVRYWDLAATEFDGCYTCGALLAMTEIGEVYVENITRGQWSTMVRNLMIKETADRDAHRYNNEVQQVFEQEPGSGGKEQAQQMVRMLAGMPVFRDIPSRGKNVRTDHGEKLPGAAKVYRAQPFSAQCEAGNVYIARADWNDEWMSEVTAFPEMKICDQVDACSACYNYLAKSKVPMPGDILTVAGTSDAPHKYGQRSTNRLDLPTFVGRN